MSEFRKDMRKDIGNKKIAIVRSLVEVSGFIANLIGIIDGHSNEIDRLTAELAAKDDWTPITSVEQVEGLPEGFYECERTERVFDNPYIMLKLNDEEYKFLYHDGLHVTETKNFAAYGGHSYKLIRAFEPAAPSIPEGAIENTLENRNAQRSGTYLFVYDDYKRICLNHGDHDWTQIGGVCMGGEVGILSSAKYFYKLDDDEATAALEALAKGEL